MSIVEHRRRSRRRLRSTAQDSSLSARLRRLRSAERNHLLLRRRSGRFEREQSAGACRVGDAARLAEHGARREGELPGPVHDASGRYLADWGQAYGSRSDPGQGSGLSYGWVVPGTSTPLSLVGNGRNRNNPPYSVNDPDLRLATFVHMQGNDIAGFNGVATPGAWEVGVPNGTYTVTVAVGDDAATGQRPPDPDRGTGHDPGIHAYSEQQARDCIARRHDRGRSRDRRRDGWQEYEDRLRQGRRRQHSVALHDDHMEHCGAVTDLARRGGRRGRRRKALRFRLGRQHLRADGEDGTSTTRPRTRGLNSHRCPLASHTSAWQ